MALTNAAVKAARPSMRAYKLADERGLFLFVAPTGLRSWRMKFRFQGREKLLTFGCFPAVSLNDARARRDAAREQLRRGMDPSAARRRHSSAAALEQNVAATFEPIARSWHAQRRSRWSTVHAADVIESLERHVFPAIGARALAAIDAPTVLELIQSIEARGALETARRIRQRIAAVFHFAVVRRMIADNPAAGLAGELQPRPAPIGQAAITDLGGARALLAAVDALRGAPAPKLASRLLALTAVRSAAVRGAVWAEFEGIDWTSDDAAPAALWRIPAARMKLALAKKGQATNDHLVPLVPAAVDVLRAARRLGGDQGDLVFPGRGGAAIGEAAIRALYRRAGFGGRHVPHGWRATFSTIMNERHPEDRMAIDRALAHAAKDKVEAAYNRAEHLARRRWLFERWAEELLPRASLTTPGAGGTLPAPPPR